MNSSQLGFSDVRSYDCTLKGFTEEEDNHCTTFGGKQGGYDYIGEDHPLFAQTLADIGNVGFNDIQAKTTPFVKLPPFVPTIRHGSKKLLQDLNLDYVAISIGDVVSSKELRVIPDVRARFGIPNRTKVVMLGFGKDGLIERIWTRRYEIFPKLALLDIDLFTAINYSIWFNQPHAERLINLKRSLITYQELQALGVTTIPHLYWFGHKDLMRWTVWLADNPSVRLVAINLQTERRNRLWADTMADLRFLVANLPRPVHFLITGPSTIDRITQIKAVLPSFTLTNGNANRLAASSHLLDVADGKQIAQYVGIPRNKILKYNIAFYEAMLETYPIDRHIFS